MNRLHRYHILSIFGDMKPHDYTESVKIGSLHFANPVNRKEIWSGKRVSDKIYYSDVIEKLLQQCFNDELLKLVDNAYTLKTRSVGCNHQSHPTVDNRPCISCQIYPRDYSIQITQKGRECLGMEQIARDGDYNFYKNFGGTISSAKKINPGLFQTN